MANIAINKANNTTALDVGSSWTGGVVPDSTDVAKWGVNVTAANSVSAGAGFNIGAIRLTAAQAGTVTITTAGNLTLTGLASVVDTLPSGTGLYIESQRLAIERPTTIINPQIWYFAGTNNAAVYFGVATATGTLNGSAKITKTGPGVMGSYRPQPNLTSTIDLLEGSINIGNIAGASWGTGPINLNPVSASGIVGLNADVNGSTVTFLNPINVYGNFLLGWSGATATSVTTLSAPVSIFTTSSITASVIGIGTITGEVSSSGNVNIIKTGTGTLNFNTNNPNLKGTLRLAAGTTNTTAVTGALQNIIIDYRSGDTGVIGAISNYVVGGWTGDRSITLTVTPANFGNSVGLDATYSGVLGGTPPVTKVGTNRQVLLGNNTRTGTLTVTGGTLCLAHANAAGNTNSAITANGGTLELSGGIALFSKPLSISGSGYNNSGSLRSTGGNNIYSGSISLAGPSTISVPDGKLTIISGLTGSTSLVKSGAGSLELDGESRFTGQTTVSEGTLIIAATTPVSGTLICDSVGAQDIAFGNITRVDIPKYDGGTNGIKVINLDNSSGVGVDFHTYIDSTTYAPTFSGKGTFYKHGTGSIDLRNKTTTNISIEAGSMIADETSTFSGSSGASITIKSSLQTPGLTHMTVPNNLTFSNNATMTFGG